MMRLVGNRRRRQRLLAPVQARLERFGVDQNPATVLDPEAVAELTALLETVPDPTADIEIAHAAGWLHWYRYLVLDSGSDQQDFADAMAWFVPVYQTRPDAVPDQVRTYFGRLAVSDDPQALADHAVTLLEETLRAGDGADLDAAIDAGRQAVAASPADHPGQAGRLSNLGAALGTRFEQTGDRADLDAAIDLLRQAVAASPADHPGRAVMLYNLSNALQTRLEQTGDRADLDAAIDLLRQAVAASPADDPGQAGRLSNLGAALQTRFEQTGDRADLDAAIDLLRQAVAASPADHPDRAVMLYNLSNALQTRLGQAGDGADLDEAIDAERRAAAASPTDHPDRAGRLSSLGAALGNRFERTGNRADIDAAIDLLRQAVAASPADHPDRAVMLSNLGYALQTRFGQTGDGADIDEAIDLARQAVAASPADRAGRLSSLGAALGNRFRRTGDRADIDAAIDLLRQAVAASPADHPDLAMYLSNLGNALRARFERTGDRADLDAAIDAGRQAAGASLADHPGHAVMLSNLGAVLQTRFELTGDRVDLDAAIDLHRQAVAASPADHPGRAMYLSNLGATLANRFERTGDGADLDEAIDLARQAVAASPADHPGRAIHLFNLGNALRTRFELTGDRADLDEAIDLARQAVAASPADHADRTRYLANLGNALRTRFELTGDRADLDEAIDLARQAVAAGPADHPDRAERLSNLAYALRARFERTGERADLDAVIDLFRQAVAVEAASPRFRAAVARSWGRTAADGQRWREAVAGFAAAAELLGLVAPRSLTRGDQEHLLEELGGLGAEAAACCVHAGLTNQAVELFEQGRGVLLGQALDTRTDLTALTVRHPDLAARFTLLRDDVDRTGDLAGPPPALPPGMDGTDMDARAEAARRDIERRRAAATAFDQVIAKIRQLPDFGGFLRPPPVAELLAAAAQGPLVVVTVSRFGSYALVLADGGVLDPVPLTGLTPETVLDRVAGFVGALEDAWSPAAGAGGRAAAEQQLGDTLGWLWDALADPVLDRLGITGPPRDGLPWPRLWWCVSGLLSFLPVHAAGHHHTRADVAPATVIDRVISSYTPTIRALAHARRPGPTTVGGAGDRLRAEDRVVAIAMPYTLDAPDLPGAQAEAAELQRRFPGRVTVLTGPQATHDTVLAALPAGRWAHFACHGASDLTNPSASCLLLTDHRQRPLTVAEVARLRLDGAGLAFLSACSTARPGGRLVDEAIHLASAFQLAGYRHVIATLWPIGDRHAVDIAADIYATLAPTSEADVASAVHAAVRRMRRLWGWDMPSVWASHIHVGA
jgi:protein involved in temperature-dependent protein secretion